VGKMLEKRLRDVDDATVAEVAEAKRHQLECQHVLPMGRMLPDIPMLNQAREQPVGGAQGHIELAGNR
jgi:hypothetical protein